jgi:uncharacterized protein YcbX
MTSPPAGALEKVFRYPVKSMAGEPLTAARVLAEHGLQGDRAFAVLDVETDRVASAKHPRSWRPLLDYAARFVGPLADGERHGPIDITTPDGLTLRSDRDDIDARLSTALGRPVRLATSPPPHATRDDLDPETDASRGQPLAVGAAPGTFFDFAPIHLVTTATLARLQALQPASRFDVARFRPNLVIDTGAADGFVENDWVGHTLAIGEQVRLCITFPCPRCVMTTLAQGFALLGKRMPAVGAYATIVQGGTIRPGDPVRLEGRAPLRRAAAFAHVIGRAAASLMGPRRSRAPRR